jgi:hypothetical protein
MSRRFTLAEAQTLIPRVEGMLRQAIEIKSSYDEAEKEIQNLQERVMLMGGIAVDRESAVAARTQRDGAAAQLRSAIEQVQEVGCLIKDLDIGLIDFPTTYRGNEVYLCWKLGEGAIEYWHGVEEGFRGRKKIDRDFLEHHQGSED